MVTVLARAMCPRLVPGNGSIIIVQSCIEIAEMCLNIWCCTCNLLYEYWRYRYSLKLKLNMILRQAQIDYPSSNYLVKIHYIDGPSVYS